MRKIRRKNKSVKIVICSFICCLLFLGVGYSVLTTNLNFQVKANKNAPEKLMDVIRKKNVSGNQEGLVTDATTDRNIRYAGNNDVVKNYIKFNNELWRIIGIVDGNVKIVRNESAANMAYDQRGYAGLNDWGTTEIATYLNGTYYNSLSTTAKNMILEATYYLGSFPSGSNYTVEQIYSAERGTKVPPCVIGTDDETSETCPRKVSWKGKVGLPYPSDYGYAVGSQCSKDQLEKYNVTECKDNDWLFYNVGYWTITPYIGANFAMYTIENGLLSTKRYGNLDVYPTIYLKSNVEVTGGRGTVASPYEITLP